MAAGLSEDNKLHLTLIVFWYHSDSVYGQQRASANKTAQLHYAQLSSYWQSLQNMVNFHHLKSLIFAERQIDGATKHDYSDNQLWIISLNGNTRCFHTHT